METVRIRRRERRKKRNKWIIGALLLMLLAGMGVLPFAMQAVQTASQIYAPLERLPSEPRLSSSQAPKQEGYNYTDESAHSANTAASGEPVKSTTFLLVGVDRDSTDTDIGRADVILLAVMNPSAQKLTLLSIPRDTYVDIAGKGYKDKINHSYRYGMNTVIATVENFTGVLVDHYVAFNFDGFVKAIDAIGGLTLKIDEGVAEELGIPSGHRHLDGRQALEFARFRDDGKGDFGRNDRHQEVLAAVLEQTRAVRSPAMVREVLETVGEDVRTDLAFTQIVSLVADADVFGESDVERLKYKAQTARLGPQNLSYVIIQEAERERISKELKQAADAAGQ